MSTAKLGLTYLTTNILDPSLPVNEDLLIVDALIPHIVVDKDLVTPPTTTDADVGKVWIVGPAATGRWSGKANQLAVWRGVNSEHYIVPTEGYTVDVIDEDIKYRYSGSAWVAVSAGGTVGKHLIPINAGGMAPSVSGGCAALTSIASASNQPDIVTLDFDPATAEYAQFAIAMPKSWNEGTITVRFRWSHAATTTNFGVVWALQAVGVSDDDPIAVAYGTAQTVTDTGGTTNDLYITSETSSITVGGSPAAGDTVFFRAYRDATNGSDTMAIDARLHGIDVFITTDAETDA